MGLLSKIFGGGNRKEALVSEMTPDLAMKIVSAYGGAMEDGPIPGLVADVKTLPYPKARIKEALRYAMSATTDKAMREQLVQAYIFLADYQEGVGSKTIGIDSMNADPKMDIRGRAKDIVQQGNAYAKFKPMVEAEIKESLTELRKRGLMEGL